MSNANLVRRGNALPDLTNPATAGQILKAYQAIDANGEVLTGTYYPKLSTSSVYLPKSESVSIYASGKSAVLTVARAYRAGEEKIDSWSINCETYTYTRLLSSGLAIDFSMSGRNIALTERTNTPGTCYLIYVN